MLAQSGPSWALFEREIYKTRQQFCSDMGIYLVSIVANHHEGSAIVESANRTIREHLALLALAESGTSLIVLVAMATFYKNTSDSHHNASPFELLYD